MVEWKNRQLNLRNPMPSSPISGAIRHQAFLMALDHGLFVRDTKADL